MRVLLYMQRRKQIDMYNKHSTFINSNTDVDTFDFIDKLVEKNSKSIEEDYHHW